MITNLKDVLAADIIVIGESFEAGAIRALLESFSIQIRMHYIGNIKHLIALFEDKNYFHKIVIICCHGDHDGLLIPKLAPKLEKTMPFHERLTDANLDKIINLNGQLVINTGCYLGKENFAQIFLNKGAGYYIGSNNYIEASAIIVFITVFMYFYLTVQLPIDEAFSKAYNIDSETLMMQFMHPNKLL